MQTIDVRDSARAYEASLPAVQRKQLGQYFTGIPLGKLLVHLALDSDTRTVLDPMAGHGDLLDASLEAAREREVNLERLDGIEIDEPTAKMCRERLAKIVGRRGTPQQQILSGNAFDTETLDRLPLSGYDLVITNPPYVRYQTRNGHGQNGDKIRTGLKFFLNSYHSTVEKPIWEALIEGYSGLADLSIPSWILAGLLSRPGGRLALVVPATWRSRDYADVIQYLLLRCFTLEYIIEDTQPGWFTNALVRTHLLVARKLTSDQAITPLRDRSSFPTAEWIQIAPEAASIESLVGTAFNDQRPEAAFAVWLRNKSQCSSRGIHRRDFDLKQEWTALEDRISSRRWYKRLEGSTTNLPLFSLGQESPRTSLPEAIRDIIPSDLGPLHTLEDAGIRVGQGLRTGCNHFFYVTAIATANDDFIRVKASPALKSRELTVPTTAIRPVLRRQSEIPSMQMGHIPPGRVLDLRSWVLPEDLEIVETYTSTFSATGESFPQNMPEELASFVRFAALTHVGGAANSKRIPDLSAVRTNIRKPRKNVTPRFWYMIPPFGSRHLPTVFIPRINNYLPWAEANFDPPILIDANFSTIWSSEKTWTRFALKAMLNSIWCRTFMEALGTPLGGGALKLEASHLRRMLIPNLSDKEREILHTAGKELTANNSKIQEMINHIVLRAVLVQDVSEEKLNNLAETLEAKAKRLRRERQRVSK